MTESGKLSDVAKGAEHMNETTETSRSDFRYKRVLLKISGEALMGDTGFGIDMATCDRFARGIAASVKAGAEICLVIGGGNIFRGLAGAAQGMERAQADLSLIHI